MNFPNSTKTQTKLSTKAPKHAQKRADAASKPMDDAAPQHSIFNHKDLSNLEVDDVLQCKDDAEFINLFSRQHKPFEITLENSELQSGFEENEKYKTVTARMKLNPAEAQELQNFQRTVYDACLKEFEHDQIFMQYKETVWKGQSIYVKFPKNSTLTVTFSLDNAGTESQEMTWQQLNTALQTRKDIFNAKKRAVLKCNFWLRNESSMQKDEGVFGCSLTLKSLDFSK